MNVKSGEKIGIIGRTGAGKTSITVALYRLTEYVLGGKAVCLTNSRLTSGCIRIDGMDVSKIGLHILRSSIAIIPQDPVLFSGTLRSNLDPFDLYDDDKLYDAMQRACLLGPSASPEKLVNTSARFSLDSVIEDEGSNLSPYLLIYPGSD